MNQKDRGVPGSCAGLVSIVYDYAPEDVKKVCKNWRDYPETNFVSPPIRQPEAKFKLTVRPELLIIGTHTLKNSKVPAIITTYVLTYYSQYKEDLHGKSNDRENVRKSFADGYCGRSG